MSLRNPTLASREGLPIPILHEDSAPEPYTLLGLFRLKSLHPHRILIIAPTVAPSENPRFFSFHLEGSPPSLPKVLVKGWPHYLLEDLLARTSEHLCPSSTV